MSIRFLGFLVKTDEYSKKERLEKGYVSDEELQLLKQLGFLDTTSGSVKLTEGLSMRDLGEFLNWIASGRAGPMHPVARRLLETRLKRMKEAQPLPSALETFKGGLISQMEHLLKFGACPEQGCIKKSCVSLTRKNQPAVRPMGTTNNTKKNMKTQKPVVQPQTPVVIRKPVAPPATPVTGKPVAPVTGNTTVATKQISKPSWFPFSSWTSTQKNAAKTPLSGPPAASLQPEIEPPTEQQTAAEEEQIDNESTNSPDDQANNVSISPEEQTLLSKELDLLTLNDQIQKLQNKIELNKQNIDNKSSRFRNLVTSFKKTHKTNDIQQLKISLTSNERNQLTPYYTRKLKQKVNINEKELATLKQARNDLNLEIKLARATRKSRSRK